MSGPLMVARPERISNGPVVVMRRVKYASFTSFFSMVSFPRSLRICFQTHFPGKAGRDVSVKRSDHLPLRDMFAPADKRAGEHCASFHRLDQARRRADLSACTRR